MLAEHITIKEGRLSPKDSIQYDMLSPTTIPEAKISFIESTDPACGLGSIAQNLLPAAYATALAQITGKQVKSIPLDTKYVYDTLENQEEE